jgi:hypothetical protein
LLATGLGATGLVSEGLSLDEVAGVELVGSLNCCLSGLGLESVGRAWEEVSGCGSGKGLVATDEGGEIRAGSGRDGTTDWGSLVGWLGAAGTTGAGCATDIGGATGAGGGGAAGGGGGGAGSVTCLWTTAGTTGCGIGNWGISVLIGCCRVGGSTAFGFGGGSTAFGAGVGVSANGFSSMSGFSTIVTSIGSSANSGC